MIVGAGFAGAVCARELADSGHTIMIIDKRSHIGGNAFDELDEYGVLIHRYGPHIFHTNSLAIIKWLSRFTDWRFYEHRVLAKIKDQLYPIPINKTTINNLYHLNLDETGVQNWLDSVKTHRNPVKTSEDVVLNSVGPDLCEKFFRGYTRKQWGLDLSQLAAGVAARIPTRTNEDDRYFTDTYQLMPLLGYTKMFEKILNHPNIEIRLNTEFNELGQTENFQHVIYTGPIDEYYKSCYGSLPYRSLRFEHQHISDVDIFQSVGTINYPNENEFTRITEFKHMTGQSCHGTSIVREFPSAIGDPYYPIPREENKILFNKYKDLATTERRITFVGRLAQYQYYNMDQVIGAAIKEVKNLINKNCV